MIKNKLKEIRMKEYMMNQREFAEKLDTNLKAYNSWELFRSNPTLEKALEVSQILNKTIDEIWYLE